MKYFTPGLILQGQSNNVQIIDTAEERWDEAGERYRSYLDSVRSDFPPGLRGLEDGYYLHDAVLHGIGKRGKSMALIVQLDTPPQSLLTLTYDLVEEPVIDRSALPPETCFQGNRVEWQYDEVERIDGKPFTWTQSILFSNGWEVCLHFRDVAVQEAEALFPTPQLVHVL